MSGNRDNGNPRGGDRECTQPQKGDNPRKHSNNSVYMNTQALITHAQERTTTKKKVAEA